MAVPEHLSKQTDEAIDAAYKASLHELIKVLEIALGISEDEQDVELAESRFAHGLEAAIDAHARARRIAGLDEG